MSAACLARLRRAAACAVLLTGAAGAAPAQEPAVPAELSLEHAVALARENNPTLLSQRNDVDVSLAAVRTADGDLLPTLNTSVGFGYTAPGERRAGSVVLAQQPAVYSSSFAVGAMYTLSAARLFQPRMARSELRAIRARVTGDEEAVATQVTQAYLSVLQAAEQVQMADGEIARATEHLHNARDRMEAGSLLALEVQRAEVQRGRAEIRRLRAENARAAGVQTLTRALGVRIGDSVRLVTRFEIFDPPWQAAELVALARGSNAALRASAATAGAVATRLRAARAAYLPTLNLGLSLNGWSQQSDRDALLRQRLGAGVHDSATTERVRREVAAQNRGFPFGYHRQPVSASAGLSFPVFGGFSRDQQVRQARAAAEDARLQLRAEELRVEHEVVTALLELRTSYRAAQVAIRVREAAAEELEMSQERFRLGLANSLVVIDAGTRLAEAEQEHTTAVFDFHRVLARLEALTGRPLR